MVVGDVEVCVFGWVDKEGNVAGSKMIDGGSGGAEECTPSWTENGKTCSSKFTYREISIFLVERSRQ